jgi:hypothetical protein
LFKQLNTLLINLATTGRNELFNLELLSRAYDTDGAFVDATTVVGGRENSDALVIVVELVALVFTLVRSDQQ